MDAEDEAEAVLPTAPPAVEFDDEVFALAFHPAAPLLASGLISGKIHLHPINTVMNIEGTGLVATGDDEGYIRLWDLRQSKQTTQYHAHEDFIADTTCVPHKKLLLAAGGDGRLSVFDWRREKHRVSDQLEDELLSLTIMKNTSKVACGTQDGTIVLYSWGQWADFSDRMVGHAKSIDTMVAIDEDIVVTGSSDGLIRVVNILPNKILGVLGEHGEYPVERVRLTGDRSYVGSCSHDKTVRFWSTDDIWPIVQGAAHVR